MTSNFLGASRLRRSVIYQPLAVLLTILLAPAFSWFSSGGIVQTSGSPFQASAQTILTCLPFQANAILQTVCPTPFTVDPNAIPLPQTQYIADLYQLESDAVNAYLALHGLPASNANLIYGYGRSDLRGAIRATMASILAGIIQKQPALRTTHEQNLYDWLQYLVHQNEIAEYTAAMNEYLSWQADPCEFTLDATIASAQNIRYNGAPFCGASLTGTFAGVQVPAESYYLAYGVEHSYGQPAFKNPDFAALVGQTSASFGEVTGIALAAGGIVGAAAATAVAASAAAALAAFTTTSVYAGLAVADAAFIVSGTTVAALGFTLLASGPFAIVLITAIIVSIAGMELYSKDQALADLQNLSSQLTQATNTPPDLASFVTDSSGLGMYKLLATITAQGLPDVVSTAPLPIHQPGLDATFSITPQGGTATPGPTLSYQDWAGDPWTAQTSGGWFVQTCNNSADCTKNLLPADSFIASIPYVDWSGTKWTASRLGNTFVSTQGNPATSDTTCPADPSTGVTPVPASGNFSTCNSYVSTSIPLKDASGNLVTVSLVPPPPLPVFTGPTTLSFTPGFPSTQAIVATDTPAPVLSPINNPLPSAFSLNCSSPGQCQLSFNGALNTVSNNYPLTIQAANSAGGTVQQTFTIVVNVDLAFTSPSSFSATAGFPVDFLITTTGLPRPTLQPVPANIIPPGLVFTDNGNGTARITGIATSPAVYRCLGGTLQCGIVATNEQGSITQPLTISLNPAPSAHLTSSNNATFVAGIANSVTLTSSGAITPVKYLYNTPFPRSVPGWLHFRDNGNGTAVLSGTPPDSSTGTYPIVITPDALGSLLVYNTANPFVLTVADPPVFLTANTAGFFVGRQGAFPIHATDGSISTSFVLPQGLTFTPGSPAKIEGTPAVGTGGAYTVPILDDAGTAGTASQQFKLQIYEQPQITSSNTATFFTGVPAYFAVTTTGYPSNATPPGTPDPALPNTSLQGTGMKFLVEGLPSDLQFSNLSTEGLATGTLTIQGTPSAADAGTHQVTIFAQNGVGETARQTLTLSIVAITGLAPASGKTCNGNYNGTFTGKIEVSAGQNCSFVESGGVSGNVVVNGGSFSIAGGTIDGDVRVHGASAFSFGPNTKINGDLIISDVASSTLNDQVCGTTVTGNVNVTSDAINLAIGSASPNSCPGNIIDGNLAIRGNTQPVSVYNNSVGHNLACSGDTSLTGAGNTAEDKKGECAKF